MQTYPITPVSKPRMTQRDKWQLRPAVAKYRAFADECRALIKQLPEGPFVVVFRVPMPASWSERARDALRDCPHTGSRADIDNLLKALLDALLPDGDGAVCDVRAIKLWAERGSISIGPMDPLAGQ